MRPAERVARNFGIVRRVFSLKDVPGEANECPCRLHEVPRPGSPMSPLTRKGFTDRIFDEENANVDYTQFAGNVTFDNYPLFRSFLLGLAADEKRHEGILRSMMATLEADHKLV